MGIRRWLKRVVHRLRLIKSSGSQKSAFFSYQIKNGTIVCRWQLDEGIERRIKNDAGKTLLQLRLRQLEASQSVRSISIAAIRDVGLNQHSESITLPDISGSLILELGYRPLHGDFIALQFHHFSLDRSNIEVNPSQWFPMPKEQSLHQIMYEIATRNTTTGGSERISS